MAIAAGVSRKTVPRRNDVTGAQRRVGARVDSGKPEGVTAVARAAADDLLAIAIGVGKVGVAAAIRSDGRVDAAAGIEPRLACRAE